MILFTSILSLENSYTTHRINYGLIRQSIIEICNDNEKEVMVVPLSNDEFEIAKKGIAPKNHMYSSAIPLLATSSIFLTSNTQGFGLWKYLAPIIVPFVTDIGRIVFFINAASCIYKFSNSDIKGAIKQLKNVCMGYALLLSIDTIMFFIEYYVTNAKEGIMETFANGVSGMVMFL